MSTLKTIRESLQLTQTQLGAVLGVSQGNVSFYETRGQTMPPTVAAKLIRFAAEKGVTVTYEQIYSANEEKV